MPSHSFNKHIVSTSLGLLVEPKEGWRSAVETADIHLDFHMSIPRGQDGANLEPTRKNRTTPLSWKTRRTLKRTR